MKEISSVNGVCLSLEERIKNMTILYQLKSDIKCDEMQFWGKIIGAKKYYYISKFSTHFICNPDIILEKYDLEK